jgi:regulator of replication initiation timing
VAVDQNQPVSVEVRRFTLLTHLSIGFGASCHPASTLAEGDCRGNNCDMKTTTTTILAFLFLICAALPLYAADLSDLTYDASDATVIITDCDKLERENKLLRQENQKLRRLLSSRSTSGTSTRETTTPPRSSVTGSQGQTQTHWMTSSSKKRHNSSCRYFKNSRGRMCGSGEGIACKICDG